MMSLINICTNLLETMKVEHAFLKFLRVIQKIIMIEEKMMINPRLKKRNIMIILKLHVFHKNRM